MKRDDFDRVLMDDIGLLPPDPVSAEHYTPWQEAVTKLLLGMALTTFKLEFFYLHYLLPLLGSVLLYLGCRSLRTSSRWFRLCWGLSAFKLGWHALFDVLAATPLLGRLADSPWNMPLSCLVNGATVVLLLALRAGIRDAFAAADGSKPRDWIGRGILAHLLSLALAIWSDLVPLTEPSMFGMAIMDEWSWLYYGRGIAFIILQIYLLRCIYRQSEALAGRGYDIAPAPVRLPGKQFTLAVFLAVLAALPPALWLGGRLDNGPEKAVTTDLSAEHTVIRERLMSMGMAEKLALALDETELERCATAVGVTACNPKDTHQSDNYDAPIDGPSILYEIDGGLAELSSWIVYLPDGQYRRYQWFEYREMPDCRLQEQFSVDPIGNYHTYDYSGRILWERAGSTFAAAPDVQLAGGQTAEELDEMTAWLYQEELERLGHYHYSPYYSFSIPRGAEGMRGYLAYTQDADPHEVSEFCYTFLRHQQRLLHYPFSTIDDLGGTQHAGEYGPIRSVYGHFSYYGDSPY